MDEDEGELKQPTRSEIVSYHLHIKKASQRDRTHQNKKKDKKSAEVAPWLAGMVFLRFAY